MALLKTSFPIACFCLLLGMFFCITAVHADVEFDKLYGSDLGMGVGARAIGLGGAFVSLADDGSAVYWNPAGLTGIDDPQLFVSAEIPEDFSLASLTFSPDFQFFKSWDLTVSLSYIRRLRFTGDSKEGDWSGYPSHLLDLAMVDVGSNFSGNINSKTCDTRLSLAFSPPGLKQLSVGVNYIYLK